jgi:hypothetical protein
MRHATTIWAAFNTSTLGVLEMYSLSHSVRPSQSCLRRYEKARVMRAKGGVD